MCPASTSTATPSGLRQPVTIVFASEPSGFMEKIRPPLRSRTNKRPVVVLSGTRLGLPFCGSIIVALIIYSFHFDCYILLACCLEFAEGSYLVSNHSGFDEPRGTSTVRKEPGERDKTTWSVRP